MLACGHGRGGGSSCGNVFVQVCLDTQLACPSVGSLLSKSCLRRRRGCLCGFCALLNCNHCYRHRSSVWLAVQLRGTCWSSSNVSNNQVYGRVGFIGGSWSKKRDFASFAHSAAKGDRDRFWRRKELLVGGHSPPLLSRPSLSPHILPGRPSSLCKQTHCLSSQTTRAPNHATQPETLREPR